MIEFWGSFKRRGIKLWGSIRRFFSVHGIRIALGIIIISFATMTAVGALAFNKMAEQSQKIEKLTKKNKELVNEVSGQTDDISEQLGILRDLEENRNEAVQTIIGYLECMMTAQGQEEHVKNVREECRQQFPDVFPDSNQQLESTDNPNQSLNDPSSQNPQGSNSNPQKSNNPNQNNNRYRGDNRKYPRNQSSGINNNLRCMLQ